jgi:3-oxoacyl-[acyl-carrier protein] reductase
MPAEPDKVDFADLSGRTVVITGASTGIGRAIALECGLAGADVLVHAWRRRREATEVAERIAARGQRARVMLADLADEAATRSFCRDAWDWAGDVHVWVNNAGFDVLTGETADWTFARKLDMLWQVDVRSTILLSRQVGERMRDPAGPPGDRCILNVGWDQAQWGMAGDSGEMFAAIKGAIMAFTRSLAKSLAPRVRVNCLAPGWIRTAWGCEATTDWQARARQESLRDRWGTPEDVARVARFLASPAADFLTGQMVAVNGGFRGPDGA